MALGRKLAYNVAVNVVMKVASTALALIGIGLMTRYLGTAGFGAYATVLAFFALFVAFADFGLYQVTARNIGKQSPKEEQHTIERIFTLRAIISLGILTIAALIVPFLPYEENIRFAIILIGIAFFFSSGYGLLNGVFQKHLRMDLVVITEFFGKVLQVGWIAGVMYFDAGFTWLIAGVLVAMVFNFTVITFLVRRFVILRLVWDPPYWRAFLAQSLPMGIAAIITFFYFKVDMLLLSFLKDDTAVGIYGAAYKIMENLIFFPAMVMGLMLPILSRALASDRAQFDVFANKTLKVFSVIILPIVVGILFRADDIMRVVGGADFDFHASATVLRMTAFALFFIFFGQFFTILLLVGNLQKRLMVALAFCAIFNVTGNWLLIPHFSYNAAAAMSVATEALVVFLSALLVARHIHYIPRIPQILRITVATGAMGILLFITQGIGLFSAIAIAGVTYVTALWATRAISISELRSIFAKENREATAAKPAV